VFPHFAGARTLCPYQVLGISLLNLTCGFGAWSHSVRRDDQEIARV